MIDTVPAEIDEFYVPAVELVGDIAHVLARLAAGASRKAPERPPTDRLRELALGALRGFDRKTILRFSNDALGPTALITMLVGAGGGFGRILQDTGVSQSLVAFTLRLHIPVLVLAWLLAVLLRCATGSSTVAMTAAAEIVAPIALHIPGVHPELLAIATGAGALGFSHVNDGGFWLVKEYFGMSIAETFMTWSVCETLIAFLGLGLALGLSAIL